MFFPRGAPGKSVFFTRDFSKGEHGNRVNETSVNSRSQSGILLTGGTGFLGSHLAAHLLERGYRLYLLARPLNRLSADERIRRLPNWVGLNYSSGRLKIIEGDLNAPDLGLNPVQTEELLSAVAEIIHCASDTSFSERKRSRVEKANIENFRNLLGFAAKGRCTFLHLVSTAYAAGKKKGTCPAEWIETSKFNNVYEETKHRAEKLAFEACEKAGIGLKIYRPSIVYGNSRTGKTLRFNAVYYPVRILVFLRNLFMKDILDRNAENAREMGIYLDGNRKVHLPVRIETVFSGGINLIPVDYFTRAFTAIMENREVGGIFHIVNAELKPIAEIITYIQKFFHIKGIQAVSPEAFDLNPPSRLDILFNRYTEAYRPYMRDERIFESSGTEAILKEKRIVCPDFDYAVFSRCMRFALASDWGQLEGGEENFN